MYICVTVKCAVPFIFFGPDWSSAGPRHNRGQNLIIHLTRYTSFGPRGSDLAASISAELIFARLLFAFYPWGRAMVRTVYRTHVTWGASVANERDCRSSWLLIRGRLMNSASARQTSKALPAEQYERVCTGEKFVSLKYSNAQRRRQLRPQPHGVWFK